MEKFPAKEIVSVIIKTLILDHFGDEETEDCADTLVADILTTIRDNNIVFAYLKEADDDTF